MEISEFKRHRIRALPFLFSFFLLGWVALIASHCETGNAAVSNDQKIKDELTEKLEKLGLLPGGTAGSFFHSISFYAENNLGLDNSFANASGEDFVPLSFSKNGKLEKAGVVFAGYGISAPAINNVMYDDYRGIKVKGKIVIVLTGNPSIGATKSIFSDTQYSFYSTPQYKIENALKKGAAGIILVHGPLELNGAIEPALQFSKQNGGGAVFDILVGAARANFIDSLIGKKLLDLQTKIAQTQKPQSFVTSKQIKFSVDLQRTGGGLENLVALLPAKDKNLKNEFIVLGVPYMCSNYENKAALQLILEIAERLVKLNKNRRNVLFTFFAGEEFGQVGSQAFLENLPNPKDAKIVGAFIFDRLEDLENLPLLISGINSSFEMATQFSNAIRDIKIKFMFTPDVMGSSSHVSFWTAKIPGILFSTGYRVQPIPSPVMVVSPNINGVAPTILDLIQKLILNVDQLERSITFNKEFENPEQQRVAISPRLAAPQTKNE